MRRLGPRPLSHALEREARRAAPATQLARVQRDWPTAAGERVARESEPVAERDGVVTVACRSAVWAQELQLLAGDLADRLNEALQSPDGGRPVRRLRFVTRSSAGEGPVRP